MQYSTASERGRRAFIHQSLGDLRRERTVAFFWPQGGAPRPKRTTFHNPFHQRSQGEGRVFVILVCHWERVCLDYFSFVLSDGWTALHPSQSAEHAVSQHAPHSCRHRRRLSAVTAGTCGFWTSASLKKKKREHTHKYNLYFLMSHCGHMGALFTVNSPRFTLRGALNN